MMSVTPDSYRDTVLISHVMQLITYRFILGSNTQRDVPVPPGCPV